MIKTPQILKFPNFKKLYYAGLTSELGSFVTETALMLLVFQITYQNKSNLGIIRAAFLISLTIGSLIGGPLGEKYNRRKILIWTDVLRIPAILLLFFHQSFTTVIISNSIIAFFTGVYNPSRQAMINDIVPQKDITKANSLFGATMAILHMVGPFVGATMFTFFNGVTEVLWLDLVTYILGIYLLKKMIYIPPKNEKESKIDFFKDIREGLRYTKNRLDLVAILLNGFIAGISIGILVPLLLPFVTEVLGLGEREYGIALSLFGLGGIIGGILAQKLSSHFKSGKIIILAILLEPVFMILWLYSTNYYLNCFVLFLWGIDVFVRIPAQLNYISHTVETNYLSRIHSLLDLSFVIPNISGGIIIALIGTKFTTHQILFWTSIFFFLSIVPRFFGKDMQALFHSEEKKVSRDESIQDH